MVVAAGGGDVGQKERETVVRVAMAEVEVVEMVMAVGGREQEGEAKGRERRER